MGTRAIYQDDVAYIHHAGFGDFSRRLGPELLRLLHAAGIRRGTLVDLGCGSGIWAAMAHRHGFRVVGVDQSAAMLRLARRTAPGVRFRQASLHKFKLPPCEAVTSIGEPINYLAPNERPRRRLEPLFARMAASLRPGGLLLFDVIVREGKRFQYRNWRAGRDWAVLFEASEDARQRLLTRRHIAFRKVGRGWRRSEETHRVQVFARAEVLRALRRAGFITQAQRSYGNFALLPRRLAFISRKQ